MLTLMQLISGSYKWKRYVSQNVLYISVVKCDMITIIIIVIIAMNFDKLRSVRNNNSINLNLAQRSLLA